jgi:Alcohol dehydrogenase GroES-like domain
MKGLRILGDRRAELTTIPQPEPRSGWVVLRPTMSAVCGSDLHLYRRSADRIGDRSNRVAGHESVGVVEKVGPGVEDLAPGTRVVVFQHYGCGRCSYCRTGEPMFCPNRSHVWQPRRTLPPPFCRSSSSSGSCPRPRARNWRRCAFDCPANGRPPPTCGRLDGEAVSRCVSRAGSSCATASIKQRT